MAFTEHRGVKQFRSFFPSSNNNSSDGNNNCRKVWTRESHNQLKMPTYDHTFASTSRTSGGEFFFPLALDVEDGNDHHDSRSSRVVHKRRRTAVVMEPGSLLSSSFSRSSSPLNQDSRVSQARMSSHNISASLNGSSTRKRERLENKVRPHQVTRKVSFDPLHGNHRVEQRSSCQGPAAARVSPESGPAEVRRRCTSRGNDAAFMSCDSMAECTLDHDHDMAQCFQPPVTRLPPRFSLGATHREVTPPILPLLAAQSQSVSFSHDDLEPIPLDQQEMAFFHSSTANARHHRHPSSSSFSSSSVMAGTKSCKKDDPSSMDGLSCSSHSIRGSSSVSGASAADHRQHHHHDHQETQQHHAYYYNQYNNNKRGSSCDEEEYPSWEMFADIENVPSDLRDDEVMTYLEPNRDVTSSINHNHIHNHRNPRWESMLMTYTNNTTRTADQSPLFWKLSPSASYSATSKESESPKQQQELDTLKPNSTNDSLPSCTSNDTPRLEPYGMTQKKSRFKHYKSWGLLGTWGIRDVKSKLRELKLSTSGNKDKLLDRLRQAFANES